MKISIFGTGYVGLVTGACLANLGHEVMCVDVDKQKIESLKQGLVPFFEPGLKELVKKNAERKRLFFTTHPQEAIEFGEVIFNCVGTPSKEDGSADLTYVYQVAENVGKYINGYKVFINKSTVPPGTAKEVYEIIKKQAQFEFDVVSNPEFLKEGTAIKDFNEPDRIIIGHQSEKAKGIVTEVYSGTLRNYTPVIYTNWETAELIKYANNAFLSTKISFINEVANICDKVGADIRMVTRGIGTDYRINPRFLHAGIGYGGSCFPKDVKALAQIAKKHGYQARLIEEVDLLNQRQRHVFLEKIKKAFNHDLKGKQIGLLGLSFKPKTSDIREAPSLTIIEELLKLGANIKTYDPEAMDESKKTIGNKVVYCNSVYEAAENSHALIILTEWDEFRNLELAKLKKNMLSNKLFDGRNIYEPELVRQEGFEYYGIGRKN